MWFTSALAEYSGALSLLVLLLSMYMCTLYNRVVWCLNRTATRFCADLTTAVRIDLIVVPCIASVYRTLR